MLYFTSDLHLGHANIIRYCNRPFSDVAEMDQTILQRWNTRVQPEDTVYILGDLMFYCKCPEQYLPLLSGQKHLILGNHDPTWMARLAKKEPSLLQRCFVSICPQMELSLDGQKLILSHYPLLSWHAMENGSWLIFGHIHNTVNAPYWPLLHGMDHALNCGVDVNDFQPVTLPELIRNNETFRRAHPPQNTLESIVIFRWNQKYGFFPRGRRTADPPLVFPCTTAQPGLTPPETIRQSALSWKIQLASLCPLGAIQMDTASVSIYLAEPASCADSSPLIWLEETECRAKIAAGTICDALTLAAWAVLPKV